MAGKSGVGYARGQWAASDSKWCKFMDEATDRLLESERSDVARATMRVLRHCHSHMWPSDHWTRERKSWPKPYDSMAVPAFRVSESTIAAESGLSRQQARTAFSKAVCHGLLVKLADASGRGQGNGAVAATYTFGCYVPDRKQKQSQRRAAKPKKGVARKWGLP